MSHAKVHDSLQAEITLQSQIFSNSQMSAQTTIARIRSLARLSGGFFNKLREGKIVVVWTLNPKNKLVSDNWQLSRGKK